MYSMPGENRDCAAEVGAGAGKRFEIGKRAEGHVDFAGGAAKFVALDAGDEIGGKILGVHKGKKSVMGIDAGRDDVAADFFAGLEDDTGGAAIFVEDFPDGGVGANFDAQFAGSGSDGIGDLASAAAAEAPGAERAIDFAHVVMQENVSGAGRTDAEECADDAGGGHGGFEDVGLEPLIEEIGGAHGHELDQGVAFVRAEFAEALQHEVKLLEIFRIQRGGIRRDHRKHRLHEAAHRRHHFREFVVGFGVEAGVATDFTLGFGVIVDAPKVVAIEHR
jgi:hypothetical protein